MKRTGIFFFISFLLFNHHLIAQEQGNIIVFGKVTDPAGNAIKGVSVSDIDSQAKTVTDIRGIYQFSIASKPTTISFSYIGFKTIKEEISATLINKSLNGKIGIDLQMEQETYKLPGIDISGKPYEWVYKNPNAWVVDYDFISDTTILLLMIENHHHFLRIINDKNTVLFDYDVHISNAGLFKDCFGNIHLLTKDSAYQVYIYDTLGIYIYPAVSRKLFNSKMVPCVYADSTNVMMKLYGEFKQSISLMNFNRTSKHQTLIYSVSNEENIRIDEELANEIIQLKKKTPDYDFLYSDQISNGKSPADLEYDPFEDFMSPQDINDKEMADLEYSLYLYTKPIQMDVFSLNDSLYIIDYFKYKLTVLKDDSIDKRELAFDKGKFELEHTSTFIDFRHKRIFLMNLKDGIAYLKELNLSDLNIKSEFMISEHIYPQKIKIRGDYVYYLYGGIINEGEKYLYREKLKK